MSDRFAELRRRLVIYDRHCDTLDTVSTDDEQRIWDAREKTLAARCAEAFADATANVNPRETALLARPVSWVRDDFIHRIAKVVRP